MADPIRVRPKLGDLVQIATPGAFAYAQYTHKHPVYGALIRVFPGLFTHQPQDLTALAATEPQFSTFFPLGAACSRGITTIVANLPIHPQLASFPTFRTGVPDKSGAVRNWWLWDGEVERNVGALTTELSHLPIRGVINETLLVERIVGGWHHAVAT